MILDNKLLDKVTEEAKKSERLRMNFNLHNSLDAKAQRLFNAIEPGTVVPIHRHQHTSETYILMRGKIDVIFYDEKGNKTEVFNLDPLVGNYGIHIPIGQWHNLEVLESGSVILEVKDGPYAPIAAEDLL